MKKKMLLFCLLTIGGVFGAWRWGTSETRAVSVKPADQLLFEGCKNVEFRYTNGWNQDIQVKKVKYFNKTTNNWKTEDVYNQSCTPGHVCYTGKQDLSANVGDNITSIVFNYNIKKDGHWNGDYSSQEFHPGNGACRTGLTYGSSTNWTIISSESSGEANGACKSTQFKFTNGRREFVFVESVEFYNSSNGKWKTQGVQMYAPCSPGQTCTIDTPSNKMSPGGGIDLADAGGDNVTKVIFHYKYKADTRGAKYSSVITSKTFEPSTPKCTDNKIFGTGQKWTIGN